MATGQFCVFLIVYLSIKTCFLTNLNTDLHHVRGAPLKKKKKKKKKKARWNQFTDLTATDLTVADHHNINNLTLIIETLLIDAARAALPLKGTSTKTPVPWFDENCKVAKRERLRAQRALQRNNSLFNRINFKRCKARCRYVFKQAQQKSWHTYLSKINQFTSVHKIWKIFAKLSGKFKPSPPPILRSSSGHLISDHKAVADELARSFANVTSDRNYPTDFLRLKRNAESSNLNFDSNRHSEYNEQFTMHELTSCLKLTSDTSPGIDKITYKMIRNTHPSLLNLILKMFNLIFSNGTFPDRWRTAIVIPILKPGKDPRAASSYRPISLTSCLCKLLEKMVNTRLMWILDRGNHINPVQSGFRHNRSTTDNIVTLADHFQSSIVNKCHSVAVFFDLKKAYDMAWKRGIMNIIYSFGLRGALPIFLTNFLSDRRIVVRINNVLSDPAYLMEGVPQGSVLSCTLFLIAVNDIVAELPRNVSSSVYVDDLVLYTSGGASTLIERRMQTAINAIARWSKRTGFVFSTEKTVALHVCRRRNCPKLANNLSLYGSAISAVDSCKYLGVTFDSSLNWKLHITLLKKSCIKTLNLLRYLTSKNWGADRVSLLRLFIMLIKPKLEYGSEAFSSASPTLLSSLNPIENSAIRISTGAYRTSPVLSLYAESGLRPPSSYRDSKLLNFFTRLIVNNSHPLHDEAITIGPLQVEIINNNQLKLFKNKIGSLITDYQINLTSLLPETCPPSPIWKLSSLDVCCDLFALKKNSHNTEEMKRKFHRSHQTP